MNQTCLQLVAPDDVAMEVECGGRTTPWLADDSVESILADAFLKGVEYIKKSMTQNQICISLLRHRHLSRIMIEITRRIGQLENEAVLCDCQARISKGARGRSVDVQLSKLTNSRTTM